MPTQSRSAGGGVRNLRAMFEQKDGSSTAPLRPPPASQPSPTILAAPVNGLFRPFLRSGGTDTLSSRTVSNPAPAIQISTETSSSRTIQEVKYNIPRKKCDVQTDRLMARNPYAGLSASSDPYTNGGSYGTSPVSSASLAPSTEEYDPYGDRYGTPPISNASSSRERRGGGGRTGGYGGFYEDDRGSAPAVQPAAQQQDRFDGYGQRSEDEPPVRVSPNRRAYAAERGNARGYRDDRSDGDSERSRGPEYRRGGERSNNTNGNGAGDLPVGRSRGAARGGGDGTRQIEGQ